MDARSEESAGQDKPCGTAGPSLRAALRYYFLGMALLGVAVGYFAGTSETPIVGTLLPLLFSLIGGAGGLFLAQVKLQEGSSIARLRLLGQATAIFVAMVLIGSAYGVTLRTGAGFVDFAAPFVPLRAQSSPPGEVVVKDAETSLELSLLRARVRALGVSAGEEADILDMAASEIAESDTVAPTGADRLLRLASVTAQALESLSSALGNTACQDLSSSLIDSCRTTELLREYLYAYTRDFRDWAERSEKESLPAAFVASRIDGLDETIMEHLHGYEGAALWLSREDAARQAIWQLQWSLIEERTAFLPEAWRSGAPLASAVDQLLGLVGNAGSTEASVDTELPRISHAN